MGPLLFLLYINDLPSASKLKCVIFADDTNLLIEGNDLEKMIDSLNKELKEISDFFKANQLKLNPKKTKSVIFRREILRHDYVLSDIILDGEVLTVNDEASFLGITIDSTVIWEYDKIDILVFIYLSISLVSM